MTAPTPRIYVWLIAPPLYDHVTAGYCTPIFSKHYSWIVTYRKYMRTDNHHLKSELTIKQKCTSHFHPRAIDHLATDGAFDLIVTTSYSVLTEVFVLWTSIVHSAEQALSSEHALFTIKIRSYLHCLLSNALFSITCIVYDHMHCLRSHALFTITCIVYKHVHCLRSHALFTSTCLVYDRMHCLRSHALFTIACIVYDHMHCLRSHALFTSTCIVYDHMHCLGSHALFTIACIVYDHMHCLQARALFTITCIVYDHMHCLRSHALFTSTCLVYDRMHCLRSHALFTITCIVYDHMHCLRSHALFTITCIVYKHVPCLRSHALFKISCTVYNYMHVSTPPTPRCQMVAEPQHRLLQRCPIRCRERRSSATSNGVWPLLWDSLLVRKSFTTSPLSSMMSSTGSLYSIESATKSPYWIRITFTASVRPISVMFCSGDCAPGPELSTGHFSWTRLDPAKRWPDPRQNRDHADPARPDQTRPAGPSDPWTNQPWTNKPAFSDAWRSLDPPNMNRIGRTEFPYYICFDGVEFTSISTQTFWQTFTQTSASISELNWTHLVRSEKLTHHAASENYWRMNLLNYCSIFHALLKISWRIMFTTKIACFVHDHKGLVVPVCGLQSISRMRQM